MGCLVPPRELFWKLTSRSCKKLAELMIYRKLVRKLAKPANKQVIAAHVCILRRFEKSAPFVPAR